MSLKSFSALSVLALLAVASFYFASPRSSVSDYQSQARVVAERCATESASKQTCYSQAFAETASREGLAFSASVLKALQTLDTDARECHGIAHAISSTAVRNDPSSWIDLISQAGMTDCAGGFLHGIIEGHIAYDPEFTISAESITEVCGKQSKLVASACAHGFGHVLLFQTAGDVYKASLVCAEVGALASECYNGMFMEDSFQEMLFEHGLTVKRSDPTINAKRFAEVKSLCHEFKNNPTASYACWSNLGHVIAEFYKHDEKQVYLACNGGPTEKEKRSCYFRGLSSLIILPDFSEPNKALSLCVPYLKHQDINAHDRCVEYIVATLIYHSTQFIERATNICSSIESPTEKEGCFRVIGSVLAGRVSYEEKETACNFVPDNYRELCLSANGEQGLFKIF